MLSSLLPLIGAGISAASSYFGGKKAQDTQQKMADQNIQLQKDFAQSGLQWKVADAKKAGIHPLFALGANTTSFSPVSIGGGAGEGLARAGQDIGRGLAAAGSAQGKVDAVTQASTQLTLERGALENQLLRSQIRRLDQQSNPPMPTANQAWMIPGQGETSITGLPGTILDKGMTRTGANPGAPHMESGAIPDVGYANTNLGMAPVPSKDVKDRIEDIMPAEWMWFMRNQVAPTLGINQSPPHNAPLPPGYDAWVFNPFTQTYQPMRRPKWMGPAGRYFHY